MPDTVIYKLHSEIDYNIIVNNYYKFSLYVTVKLMIRKTFTSQANKQTTNRHGRRYMIKGYVRFIS